jgi:galactokinase/galacturonokinase
VSSAADARAARVDALRRRASERFGVAPRDVQVALAPYRICPLGAHSDHQHGPVLGAAIDACTLLAFAPGAEPELVLESADFPGRVRAALAGPPRREGPDWGRYAAGAAAVLRERLGPRPAGVVGCVEGTLPGAGLSSSASLLIALLLALSRANGLELTPQELVRLARRAENEEVGVACGVLDPAVVAAARRDHLLAIDTRALRWEAIPPPPSALRARFLVAYTGLSRRLGETAFNRRVEECLRAARRLGELSGLPAERLGDLPDAAFEAHAAALPREERLRAAHFFGERARVGRGVAAWRAGDLAAFGALMNASCRSSIENYETGSEELCRLQQILGATPGVLGSRFSGAGFGGSAVALVEAERAEAVRAQVEAAFAAAFPAQAGRARCFLTESEDAARLLGS